MKIFIVYRPYCTPSGFNVIAKSAKEARNLAHAAYGYCSNTSARQVKLKKGILKSTFVG